ncbi:MAG: tetratricopeptide repeat protein [Hyphomicrobium sp.]
MKKTLPILVVALGLALPQAVFAEGDAAPPREMSPPGAERAVPPPEAIPPVAPPPGRAKGEPGMMGEAWPTTPEEASKTIGNLLAYLATEGDALKAGAIAASIEKLWRLPGGDTVNLLVDRGFDAASKNQLEKALKFLDAAVDLAPDYPEAWNQRAYVHYRMGTSAAALGDLRRALALEPNQFRALDGMAKILEGVGEKKAALQAYEQLLKIHPQIEGAQEAADRLKKELEGQGI